MRGSPWWLLAAAWALVIVAVMGHPAPVSAAGEGIFSLDKTSYDVDEGNAVIVGVNRTQGGTLTQDITVTLQLSGGIVDQDYPASTITQTVVFKQNTNSTFLPASFQTINQQKVTNKTVQVTIISASAGALGLPSQSPIAIHGRGTPRVDSVSPRSATAGTLLTLNGFFFPSTTSLCTGADPRIVSVPNATPQLPPGSVRCLNRIDYFTFGGSYVATDPNPIVVGPSTVQSHLTGLTGGALMPGQSYDVRAVVIDPVAPATLDVQTYGTMAVTDIYFAVRSSATANGADQFWYTAPGAPTVTSVTPITGPIVGGTTVTIRGTNLGGANCPTWAPPATPPGVSSVYFGPIDQSQGLGTPAFSCQSNPDGSITAVSPRSAGTGTFNVTVSIGAFISPSTPDSRFTYTGSPTITAITPNTGPTPGGTLVTITGTGFNGLFGGYTSNCPAWTMDNSTNPPTMVPPSPLPGPAPLPDHPLPVMFGSRPALSCSVISDTQMTAVSPPIAVGGPVQVTLNHWTNGPSPFTTAANFNYVQGPVVTAISPNSGPPQGGTVVTVSGSGFAPGAAVKFGATDAAFVQYVSPTQLQVTSPAGNGQVDILVTVAGTASPAVPADLFSYNAPTVTSVVPNAGPPAGGTVVTINGTNFTTTATVQFGANTVPITFISPVQIQATAPAGSIGAVDVRVTTNSGQSATSPDDLFTYTSGPIIASLNPGSAPTSGGTIVIIGGTNFVAPATVSFGGTNSAAVNVNSATQITAMAPAVASAGVVDIKVTTAGGTSPVSTLSKFTYVANPPVITRVSPDSGPTVGGTTIEITGNGFLGATCPGAIKFGATVVPACIVNSDTSITVVAPPGQSGPTILSVTTAGGTSELKQNYTYTSVGSGGSSGGSTGGGTGGISGGTLPPPTGEPVHYQLDFRWSLLVWRGGDGVAVALALKGNGQNDLTGRVTAVYGWDAANNVWRGYFTGTGSIPGASDLQTFTRGGVYWIAITAGPGVIWSGTDGG